MEDIREQLKLAMAAMEAQRETLGDAVVDAALAAFREKLAALGQPGETNPGRESQHHGRESTASGYLAAHRYVTVLVAGPADVAVSSESVVSVETEDAQRSFWPQLDAIITRSGGTIAGHPRGAVIAIFGAQAAQSDDAERAVRAALEMQAEIARYCAGSLNGFVQLRAGLHSGPAALATNACGETILSENTLAGRLWVAAGPDEVLISQATFRAVRGIFDIQVRDALRIEGKAEDVPVYRVRGVRPRVFRAAGLLGRSRASMVGREAERSQLQAAFTVARGERRLRIVTITGEAGVGKTRLAQEFLNDLEYSRLPYTLFRGRGDWQQNRLPYALLRELVSFHFKIEEADPAPVARDKLLRGVESWLGPDGTENAHWIGHLAGYDFEQSPYLSGRLDDPRRVRQLAFQALNHLVAAVARQTPLVVLVDDLQWADDSSLDWLDSLARADSKNPCNPGGAVLLLGLARPELFERRRAWGERWPGHDRLNLLPLNAGQAAALAGQLLRSELVTPASYSAPTERRKPGIPEPADALAGVIAEPVQVIVDRSQGNPYFIEELAQAFLEDCLFTPSAARAGEPPWRVDTDRLAAKRLPCSLTEVIQARLDDLLAGEREVLLRAAVVGPVFWESAIRGLLEMDDGPDAGEDDMLRLLDLPVTLRSLQERGLIDRHEHSAFEHTDEYAFKNALLYEVAYESQLVRCRHQDHARVAMWLAAQSGERVEINSAVIARHYERAEERLLAADWYGLAALQARRSSAPDTALRFFSRALELLPDEPCYFGQRIQFYKGIWDIQWWQTRYAEALATGQALLAVAEARGDQIVQASAWNRIAAVQNRQGEYQAALRSVQRAERMARTGGAAREVVLALFNRGVTLYRLGDADAALEAGERALAFNQSLFGQSGASGQDALQGAALEAGGIDAPSAEHQEQSARMDELRDAISRGFSPDPAHRAAPENDETMRETARILNLLAMINQRAGRYAEAEKDYRQVLSLQRERGDRGAVMAVFNSLGALASLQGDFRTAASCFQQALNLAQEIGFHELDLVCMNNLAGAEVELGEHRQAENRLREVLSRADKGTSFLLTETYRFLALACLGQQRCEEALTAGLRALELARQGNINEPIGRAWRVLGRILAAFDPKAGRPPVVVDGHECSAHTCYAASLQIFVEMGAASEHARTARELALFELERGDHREGARLWQESRDLFSRLGLSLEVERMDRMVKEVLI